MIDSLLVNIPPMSPQGQAAAGALLPLMVASGCELTLTQVTSDQFAASYLAPGMVVPIAVVGTTMADCLLNLATRLSVVVPPVETEEV